MERHRARVPTAKGTLRLHDLRRAEPSTDVVHWRPSSRNGVPENRTPFPKSIYDNVAFGHGCTWKLRRGWSWTNWCNGRSGKAAVLGGSERRLKRTALGLSAAKTTAVHRPVRFAVGPEVLLRIEPCRLRWTRASTLAIEV